MARGFLLAGAVAWLLMGVAAAVTAVAGSQALLEALPPLAIDADALGGALTAVAIGAAGIGGLHAWLVIGLRRNRPRARTAGVLLASVLAAAFLALAAAAAASALREAQLAPWLWAGCGVAALVAIGYAWTVAELVGEMRSGSAV